MTSYQYFPMERKPKLSTPRSRYPMVIASISAGFEKGDFFVREEKGSNTYFDFFEEAFNFICQKGFTRMSEIEEKDYMEIIKHAHQSIPGGCRFNTGFLLMVLKKRLIPIKIYPQKEGELIVTEPTSGLPQESNISLMKEKRFERTLNTLSTDSDSSVSRCSGSFSPSHLQSEYSGPSTSYADSWE